MSCTITTAIDKDWTFPTLVDIRGRLGPRRKRDRKLAGGMTAPPSLLLGPLRTLEPPFAGRPGLRDNGRDHVRMEDGKEHA